MLNWIKVQWGHIVLWWNRDRIASAFLERAFLDSESMGCRDSAETLERNCRMVWRRFGWWTPATSTAIVQFHNVMFVLLGDRDKAAVLTMGVLSYSVRWDQHQAPEEFLPRVREILASIAAKGMAYQIKDSDKRRLVELFPSIALDLRMRDDGLPTTERVLIWIARAGDSSTC